jgi:hypothetical protein
MARGLNGTSDRIDTPSIGVNPNNLSLSIWVYVGSLAAAYAGIIVGGAGQNLVYIKSSGAFAVYAFAASGNFDPIAGSTIATGTWHNIVLSGGNAIACNFYLDGVPFSIGAGSPGVLGTFTLGDDPGTAGRFLNGRLADFAAWSAALTAAEAAALARGARPGTIRPSSLLAWLPFDGLQSPEPDLSGNANNGTLTGTALASGPPVMMFTPRWPQFNIVAAAPTFNPAWALGKNIVIEGVAT